MKQEKENHLLCDWLRAVWLLKKGISNGKLIKISIKVSCQLLIYPFVIMACGNKLNNKVINTCDVINIRDVI